MMIGPMVVRTTGHRLRIGSAVKATRVSHSAHATRARAVDAHQEHRRRGEECEYTSEAKSHDG
jgi:hypothetical protein